MPTRPTPPPLHPATIDEHGDRRMLIRMVCRRTCPPRRAHGSGRWPGHRREHIRKVDPRQHLVSSAVLGPPAVHDPGGAREGEADPRPIVWHRVSWLHEAPPRPDRRVGHDTERAWLGRSPSLGSRGTCVRLRRIVVRTETRHRGARLNRWVRSRTTRHSVISQTPTGGSRVRSARFVTFESAVPSRLTKCPSSIGWSRMLT